MLLRRRELAGIIDVLDLGSQDGIQPPSSILGSSIGLEDHLVDPRLQDLLGWDLLYLHGQSPGADRFRLRRLSRR